MSELLKSKWILNKVFLHYPCCYSVLSKNYPCHGLCAPIWAQEQWLDGAASISYKKDLCVDQHIGHDERGPGEGLNVSLFLKLSWPYHPSVWQRGPGTTRVVTVGRSWWWKEMWSSFAYWPHVVKAVLPPPIIDWLGKKRQEDWNGTSGLGQVSDAWGRKDLLRSIGEELELAGKWDWDKD